MAADRRLPRGSSAGETYAQVSPRRSSGSSRDFLAGVSQGPSEEGFLSAAFLGRVRSASAGQLKGSRGRRQGLAGQLKGSRAPWAWVAAANLQDFLDDELPRGFQSEAAAPFALLSFNALVER